MVEGGLEVAAPNGRFDGQGLVLATQLLEVGPQVGGRQLEDFDRLQHPRQELHLLRGVLRHAESGGGHAAPIGLSPRELYRAGRARA